MKVLVTGHRGFIGRYVFADWRDQLGYKVHGIDRPDCISDFNIIGNIKKGDYDLVVHLAAWADIRESMEKPGEYYENNVRKGVTGESKIGKSQTQDPGIDSPYPTGTGPLISVLAARYLMARHTSLT